MPSSCKHPGGAIVLDLDDTLYLERDYVRSGIAAVGAWVGKTLNAVGFVEAAAALFEGGRRERLFDAAFAEIGIDASAALIARATYEYRRHRPTISLTADAEDFLDRTAAIPLALVTDGWALSQRMKVGALRLRERSIFPLVYTDDWGRDYWKPHVRAFAHVAATLAPCSSFIYVGDNPTKDFLAPRALGWRTVHIARPERLHRPEPPSPAHQADLTITSLDQLNGEVLRELGGWAEPVSMC